MSSFDDRRGVQGALPEEQLMAGDDVPGEPGLAAFVATLREAALHEPLPLPSAELAALLRDGRGRRRPAAPAARQTAGARRLRRVGLATALVMAAEVVVAGAAAAVGVAGVARIPDAPSVVRVPAESVVSGVVDAWRGMTGDEPSAPVPSAAPSTTSSAAPAGTGRRTAGDGASGRHAQTSVPGRGDRSAPAGSLGAPRSATARADEAHGPADAAQTVPRVPGSADSAPGHDGLAARSGASAHEGVVGERDGSDARGLPEAAGRSATSLAPLLAGPAVVEPGVRAPASADSPASGSPAVAPSVVRDDRDPGDARADGPASPHGAARPAVARSSVPSERASVHHRSSTTRTWHPHATGAARRTGR